MTYPTRATLVEVGPRDGLQNESTPLRATQIIQLVDLLSASGLPVIETGSFVSPRWVPQMANSAAVFQSIQRKAGVKYTALTPNKRGALDALEAQVDEVAIFVAVTESFSQKNLNSSIEETLTRYQSVMELALQNNVPVRGYLSCVLGCPYEGDVPPPVVRSLCQRLIDLGCYEVSLGDTIGTGTAGSMKALLQDILDAGINASKIAVHCHDTYGQALSNILVALQHGITIIDSSVAGLGGCPYAKGATGNVAIHLCSNWTRNSVSCWQGVVVNTSRLINIHAICYQFTMRGCLSHR